MTHSDLARRFDHAVLNPSTTGGQVEQAGRRCASAGIRGLCVLPHQIEIGRRILDGSNTRLVAVASFPTGAARVEATVEEIGWAVNHGADELDVVLPGDLIAEHRWSDLQRVAGAVAEACRGRGLKLIVEAGELGSCELESIIDRLFADPRVGFFKTGTGVYGRPVTAERIRWLRSRLPERTRLKVAGGIRSLDGAREALAAGADVLGTRSTFELLEQAGSGHEAG